MMGRLLIATFVRHGETSLNVQKLIQGHTDTPLSETGIKQAELLGRSISDVKFTKAYASDLLRAKRTAELIIEHSKHPVGIIEDRRLRERSYGEIEGKYFQILADEAAQHGVKVSEYTPKGAESYPDLLVRTRGVLDDLCALAETSNAEAPESVLVVSHGGFLIALFKDLIARSDKYLLKNCPREHLGRLASNTGLTQCSISPTTSADGKEKYTIDFLKINDISHLQ